MIINSKHKTFPPHIFVLSWINHFHKYPLLYARKRLTLRDDVKYKSRFYFVKSAFIINFDTKKAVR